MKLTPIDIHHKEFRHALRGYSEEQVDEFLDEVADEFERLFKENIDLSEKIEALQDKLREYAEMERTVHNTMVSAQRSAEEIVAQAEKEAETTRKDSELRAKEIIHTALEQKQRTQQEFMRLKQAETEFRERFARMLDEYARHLEEIEVPGEYETLATEDIEAETASAVESVREQAGLSPEAETERTPGQGAAGDTAVAAGAGVATSEAPSTAGEEAAQPTLTDEPAEESGAAAPAESAGGESSTGAEPSARPSAAQEEDPSATAPGARSEAGGGSEPPDVEPPQSGFVTSVHLGELGDESSQVEEEPELEESSEFELPSFESFGERDEDVDIEEID